MPINSQSCITTEHHCEFCIAATLYICPYTCIASAALSASAPVAFIVAFTSALFAAATLIASATAFVVPFEQPWTKCLVSHPQSCFEHLCSLVCIRSFDPLSIQLQTFVPQTSCAPHPFHPKSAQDLLDPVHSHPELPLPPRSFQLPAEEIFQNTHTQALNVLNPYLYVLVHTPQPALKRTLQVRWEHTKFVENLQGHDFCAIMN